MELCSAVACRKVFPMGKNDSDIDRMQTRDGHVSENYVFCDDHFFARVAELGSPAKLRAFQDSGDLNIAASLHVRIHDA
jgi:hypothetical protein